MTRSCDNLLNAKLMKVLARLADGREVITNTSTGRYWIASGAGMSEISKEEAEGLVNG